MTRKRTNQRYRKNCINCVCHMYGKKKIHSAHKNTHHKRFVVLRDPQISPTSSQTTTLASSALHSVTARDEERRSIQKCCPQIGQSWSRWSESQRRQTCKLTDWFIVYCTGIDVSKKYKDYERSLVEASGLISTSKGSLKCVHSLIDKHFFCAALPLKCCCRKGGETNLQPHAYTCRLP